MEKNYYEFCKDGNSDIYTMNLESRIVERITEHSSIDTSPSFSPNGKFIAFNSDRSVYNKFTLCEAMVVM